MRVITFQNILKRLSGIRIRNIGYISSTISTPTLRDAPKRVIFSARSWKVWINFEPPMALTFALCHSCITLRF